MNRQQILLVIIGVCIVIGLKAADQPQRAFNQIDYPDGVKLRLKRAAFIPRHLYPDTIVVVGYWDDCVRVKTLSYDYLNMPYINYTNEQLHDLYLPIK